MRVSVGESVLRDGFEFRPSGMTVLALEPDSGAFAGGTWVRIHGQGLSGVSTLSLGSLTLVMAYLARVAAIEAAGGSVVEPAAMPDTAKKAAKKKAVADKAAAVKAAANKPAADQAASKKK